MDIQLIKASIEYKPVISNLLQFYTYDFSEYTKQDVESNGLFEAYPHLDDYWKEESRFPYVIKIDDTCIGFVFVRLIDDLEKSYFSIAEFFIMKKYRRKGFGQLVARQIFDLYKGRWEVYQMEANRSAQSFWKKVIYEYVKGQVNERIENNRTIQSFEN